MLERKGSQTLVALCGALLFALATHGCAGGGLGKTGSGGHGGGIPAGVGGGGSGGSSGGGGGNAGAGGAGGAAGDGAGGGAAGGADGGPAGSDGGGGDAGGGGGSGGDAGATPDGGAPDGGMPDGGNADAGGPDTRGLPVGVHVQYRCTDTSPGPSTSIGLNFVVKNLGPIPVDFATFTMRYWFTADAAVGLTARCETIQPGQLLNCAQVVTTIKPAVPARVNADSYLEISITPSATGTGIGFGGAITQLTIRFQSSAPGFTQSNDYSFDPSFTDSRDFPKVTAYAGGILIWGVEP